MSVLCKIFGHDRVEKQEFVGEFEDSNNYQEYEECSRCKKIFNLNFQVMNR
jgi:hypothetical protein